MSGKRQGRRASRGSTQMTPSPQEQKLEPDGAERPTREYEKEALKPLRAAVEAVHSFTQAYTTDSKKNACIQRINLGVAVFTAIVIFFYTAITYSLLGTGQEANRINREALISVQRSYVGLKTIESFGFQDPRDPQRLILAWQFFPQWENSGTTPTKTMRQHVNLNWFDKPLSADFDFPDAGPEESSFNLLTAKATISTGPLVVPQDVMVAVKDRKFHLYFWGWAAYRDIFQDSPPHLIEFCQELIVNSGNISTGVDVKFLHLSYTFHNCVDGGCVDYKEVKKKLGEQ